MKKLSTFLKTLLVAVGIGVGSNAWADLTTTWSRTFDDSYGMKQFTNNGFALADRSSSDASKVLRGLSGTSYHTVSWSFPTDVFTFSSTYEFSFEIAMSKIYSGSKNSNFILKDTDGKQLLKLSTNDNSNDGDVFIGTSTTALDNHFYVMNYNGGSGVNKLSYADTDTWYTVTISADPTNGTRVTITPQNAHSGYGTISTKTISADVKYIGSFSATSGYNYGSVWIDNFLMKHEVGANYVEAPTFNVTGVAGVDGCSRTIELDCETDDATIKWSETAPISNDYSGWTTYSTAISTSAATIYAVATKNDSYSFVAAIPTGAGTAVKLNAPTLALSGYSDGKFTVTITHDQTNLEFVPVSTTVYYKIDNGTKTECTTGSATVPQGSTITAHIEATSYDSSDDAEFVTGEILNWPTVWSQDYKNIVNSNVNINQPSDGAPINNGILSNADAGYYVYSTDGETAATNANAGFEVYYSSKSPRAWMIRSGGMYSNGSGDTKVAIANLEEGQIVKVTSDTEVKAGDGLTRLNNISYPNTWYFEATADGTGKVSIGRYHYIYTIDVFSTDPVAPELSLDKTSASVEVGDEVSFTATITQGFPDPTIQWYSCDDDSKTNAASISGATNTTYVPSTVEPGTYHFFVRATNSEDTFDSDVITLTVTGTIATPSVTIASYDYEHEGYAITPTCATEGVTFMYKIGNSGEWQTATVPFYAKEGKLYLKAEKTGWTTAELPESKQYNLNVAPSSTSPETLISFQKSNNDIEKDVTHAYKSVTIVGGTNSAICGRTNDGKLRLRTNQSSNTITLNVNEGYVVTGVSITANSVNETAGQTIDLTSVTFDDGSNIMSNNTTFPISGADAVTYNSGTINASSSIVFTFDNTASASGSSQIYASITVTYKTTVEIAIDNAIADCKAYETSSAFATYIDTKKANGEFSSVADVYAAHTAWQIENASGNDITKVILDAAVTNDTHWNGARTQEENYYTGAPDHVYFDAWQDALLAKQTVYGLPAGTYTIKVATRASAAIDNIDNLNVYVWDGTNTTKVMGNHIGASGGTLGGNKGWSWSILIFTLSEKSNVEIGFYANPGAGLWASCDDWHLYNGQLTEPATLGTNGFTTFASPYPLDLANLPEGLTAYKAEVDAEHNKVLFTSVTEAVQANTGVLLKGNASTEYDIPVVASGSNISASNALLVNSGGNTFDAESGYTYYGMIKDSNPLTFGTFDPSTVAIPANKAYLEVSTTTSSRLIASFDDDATAVFDLNDKSEMTNDKWYDLQGRRIDGSRLNPGIYIVNGRKVVVK